MSKKNAAQSRADRAAAAMAEQQRGERRRQTLMIGGVVAVILVLVVGGVLIQQSRDTSTDVAAPGAGTTDYGLTIGEADAPHELIIYEDFLCPFCGELEAASREELATLADEGKVQVEYRPFDLLSRISDYSARSTNAFAVVLEESGPEVAKKYHDLLFENQPEESGPFPDNGDLLDLAVEAGAEESAVADGIENLT
ncbi:MAG: thioredoxin domain-containing protein, partial [Herbiconiux sp.]|nr:thioredoxin domain-containing protein [Herbiconiux sp.]